jgi:XTP/dITP diphosphohydrolase
MVIPILYFNTVNSVKEREIREIFSTLNCEIRFLRYPIVEILHNDVRAVIRVKAAEAYKKCKVPVIVEHGALCIDYLNGFPGALSKPMWDLMEGKICNIIPANENRAATALSAVCYCDGKSRLIEVGSTKGVISSKSLGENGFQWDPIFIPEGQKQTYAQMDQTEKLKYSQATKAYLQLYKSLAFPI